MEKQITVKAYKNNFQIFYRVDVVSIDGTIFKTYGMLTFAKVSKVIEENLKDII